jgi:hypothetical protein
VSAGLDWLFVSGHAADVVLVVMAGELFWLVTKNGWRVSDAACRLAPGALMVVALRSALTGLDWRWIALPLLLSFPVHLIDLRRSMRPGDQRHRADRRIRNSFLDRR